MKKIESESGDIALKAFMSGLNKEPVELKYGEGKEQLTIKIFPVIPFERRLELIESIAGTVFVSGGKTIDGYLPASIKFAKRYAIIGYFTDFKFPAEINGIWAIVNQSGLYDDVLAWLKIKK